MTEKTEAQETDALEQDDESVDSMFGTDDDLMGQYRAHLKDEGDKGESEEASSVEDSSSDDSKVKSPPTSEVAELVKLVQAQAKMIENLAGGKKGESSNTKEEDSLLPEAYEPIEAPDGFGGMDEYLAEVGESQFKQTKKVYEYARGLEEQLFKLTSNIKAEFVRRDMGVSDTEQEKIFDWAQKHSFSYDGVDTKKLKDLIETYRSVHGKENAKKEMAKRNNPNPPSTTSGSSRATRDSENVKAGERKGDDETREWARIKRKTFEDLARQGVKL